MEAGKALGAIGSSHSPLKPVVLTVKSLSPRTVCPAIMDELCETHELHVHSEPCTEEHLMLPFVFDCGHYNYFLCGHGQCKSLSIYFHLNLSRGSVALRDWGE